MPGHLAYRIGGAILVWALVVVNAMTVGLLWAGPEADGFAALGAALAGLLWGAVFGVAAGVLFGFVRPPVRGLHRWMVLGAVAVAIVLSLWLQESLDGP